MRWMLVVLLGGQVAHPSPVGAQPCFAPIGWGRPSGLTFSIVGQHFAFNGAWGNGYWTGPQPIWGYAPPIIVVPPVIVVRPVQFVEPTPALPLPPDPFAGARTEAAVERGEFVVIRPRKPGEAAPAPSPPAPRVVRPPQGPPADPKLRAAYEIAQAKEAFVAGQYGRAMERLADALKSDSTDPRPHFWIAQCQVARTEYAEAVGTIRAGLALAPSWPTKAFDMREFYGPASATFDEHLTELKAAAKADPADATLAFLVGYHRWFLGEKAEAEKLFRDARLRVRDTTVIDVFLKAKTR